MKRCNDGRFRPATRDFKRRARVQASTCVGRTRTFDEHALLMIKTRRFQTRRDTNVSKQSNSHGCQRYKWIRNLGETQPARYGHRGKSVPGRCTKMSLTIDLSLTPLYCRHTQMNSITLQSWETMNFDVSLLRLQQLGHTLRLAIQVKQFRLSARVRGMELKPLLCRSP